MKGLQKRLKHKVRLYAKSIRRSIAGALPYKLYKLLSPFVHFVDMLIFDHLFVRLLFPNRHKISERAWRSAQPLPFQLQQTKKLGIRTVINLRGNANSTTYRLEQKSCKELGINYVDYKLRSRAAPTQEELLGLRNLFKNVEYPILLHCKSGADRAGLASALFLYWVEGVPLEFARHQLSLRYGHVRQADTGLLDVFLEEYLTHAANDSIDLMTWAGRYYNPEQLKIKFKSKGWANRFLYGLLRRE
ncbi:MAG: fused DSP-PTPase phosphatase/NAD kinase-like protein [Hyphomicrobium sp.]